MSSKIFVKKIKPCGLERNDFHLQAVTEPVDLYGIRLTLDKNSYFDVLLNFFVPCS